MTVPMSYSRDRSCLLRSYVVAITLICGPCFADTFKACPRISEKEAEDGFAVRVVVIVDGDTVDIRFAGDSDRTKPYRVRLAEIDAPEKGQPYGKEAANELRALVR